MKHYLSLLCFASVSFFYVNEAAAALLLKPNPTPPLEPASYSVSGESYQIAKVTWLPDYLGNNKSHGGGRVNDSGKEKDDRNCGTYGYVDNCPEHRVGKGIRHPISGLTCYKECVCDTSYYKYSSSNCASPKVLGGESCDERHTSCLCPDDYDKNTEDPNAVCSPCTLNGVTKYKCTCKSGYTLKEGKCIDLCSGYDLTVCPAGGVCSKCPDNNARLKLDSCDTSKGWKKSGNNCVAAACPAGYTAGTTSCTSGSTKPDISLNGWSGGKQCGMCKCNNINTNCTEANYPVTSIPANATQSGTCSTGCGTAKVTRYTFECNTGRVNYEKTWCGNTLSCYLSNPSNTVCVSLPSCASLGYTKNTSSCSGVPTIKCPYDTSYVFCYK